MVNEELKSEIIKALEEFLEDYKNLDATYPAPELFLSLAVAAIHAKTQSKDDKQLIGCSVMALMKVIDSYTHTFQVKE